MVSPSRLRGIPAALLVAGLCLLPLLGGCGAGASAQEEMVLLRLDAPLRDPHWTKGQDFALALREDEPRVVKLPVSAGASGETTLGPDAITPSEELEGTPASMAPNSQRADEVYLPQPDLGRVVQMDTGGLRTGHGFDFDEPPQWAAVHPGSQTLFTLSEDGSTVSVLNLEDPGRLDIEEPKTPVELLVGAGGGARIDAPERGLEPQFWLWGPDGISHYAGSPPELKVSTPINAASFVLDTDTAQRAYVGEGGSGRVVAVEGDAAGMLDGRLREVAEQDLGGTAEYLDIEELWLIAATGDRLVQMKRDDLAVVETTDFRGLLRQQGLGDARVSGMAVTRDRVYLTLKGEPYMLSIRKTDETRA